MARVLQVFTILNRGGAETNIMNYYRHMDRSKVHFDFLVHREEEAAYEAEIRQLGGQVFRLPPINPLKLHSYKTAVKKFFDQHSDYDIIHGQNSELGVYIYEEAKRRGIPVIIAHAHNAPALRDYDLKFIFREYWKRRMRLSITHAFTCGKESAQWLFGRKLASRAFLMPNAVDTAQFKYQPSLAERVLKDLGKWNQLKLIHVGRFNKQKNHRFLLEIVAALRIIQPDFHLYLVGEGELLPDITAQIKTLGLENQVTLLGSRNDIPSLIQAMDVFLFPSLYEGLPVSLVEAQASGIQCVISDGIPAEAILVPENVTVVSLKNSASSWAEKIVQLDLSNRNDVSEIIKAKGYDIKENVVQLQNKYLELLEKNT
ncbi:glycosyltransferase family 1 protein [Kaistella rhinocerotis]|uniref:glycosyltransferase family 1 protein n=1 Tax=Kaistella rhinocerotis TaxID=3026437 RepID=UPI0025565700|nr:glycosyltransferase family 1 protein [Kaistella sp. Ran72]